MRLQRPSRHENRGHTAMKVAALVVALFGARAEATDFLRGDANDDSFISISDARYTLNWLFLGQAPSPCLDAADFDDDSTIDLSDSVSVLDHVVRATQNPAAPFPEIGEDPTEDAIPGRIPLDCDSYGNGSTLADANAALRIEVAPAQGEDEASTTVTVYVSSSDAISGYFGAITFDPAVIRGVDGGIVDLTGLVARSGYLEASTVGDEIRFAGLPNLVSPTAFPAGEDVAVAEIEICLTAGLTAGAYPLTLSRGELVDAASARAILPTLTSDDLVVEDDLFEGVGCTAPDPETPTRPEEIVASFSISSATAPAGSTVTLPFSIESNAETQGFSVSIDFDEGALQLEEVTQIFEKPDGSEYGFFVAEFDNRDETPGNDGVDEGFVIAAAVMSFTDQNNNIPPGDTVDVLGLVFRIAEEIPAGTETEIGFVDGGQISGDPVVNRMVAFGEQVDPSIPESFLLIDGRAEVVADVTLFVRGDSNGDLRVDLPDAQATLNWLFLGSDVPHCLDAADANDDGRIDIADTLRVLNWLFQGGAPLPPPNGEPGIDPTEDSLGCLTAF